MPAKRMLFAGAVAVFFAVAALYFPTLRGDFVYDSIAQILYSDYLHTPSHRVDVLTLRVVGQDQLDRNRPLHLASLMFDAAVWGREPFGYRLTSVAVHALNAALLFAFLALSLSRGGSAGRDRRLAFPADQKASCGPFILALIVAAFGALVFALHPLVVEAVAEPSNREDLLVLLPMLVGLSAVVRPVRSTATLNAALLICSFFAVLAKESGIAVPFVFAAACWLSGDFKRCLPGLIGGLFAVCAFLLASYLWRPQVSGIFSQAPAPLAEDFWTVLGVQARIWTLQLWQIVWPWNLSAHYPPPSIANISVPLAIGVLGLAGIAAVFFGSSGRLSALGATVYVLALLPASNFLPQYHPIADRYLYVPLAGVGMIAAALAQCLFMRHSSRLAGGTMLFAALAIIGTEYAANVRRQIIWQKPETLWSDVLRQYPDLAQAHLGMANVHWRAGDFAAALVSANEAVANSSGLWADPFACRAMCEWRTGSRERAVEDFRRAQRLSRVYQSEESMAEAMIFSSDQLSVLGEILRSGAP